MSGTKKPEDETDGENNATGNDGEPTVIEADGQVTSRKNVALGMFAADCLPVLMADPEAGVIGAAHCGRRGLQKGVIGATIEKMVSKGAQPERIVATLGPCICGDCYEVGGDIADEFDAQFPGTFTLSRFASRASTSPRPPCRSLPKRACRPTTSSHPVHASTRPRSTCPKTRNWPASAPPMAKAIRSFPNGSTRSAAACARSKTRCGSRIAARRSPKNSMKDACWR